MELKLKFDAEGRCVGLTSDGDYLQPFPSAHLDRWRLVDGQVVDTLDGKTDADIEAERTNERLVTLRAGVVTRIKREAAARIAGLDWRLARARERAEINAAGETVAEVLTARELIRQDSNQAEMTVRNLATEEELDSFAW